MFFSYSEGCYQSDQVIVKAIRLHADMMKPWILDTDIKVVQLVRDPRATLNSLIRLAILPSILIIENFEHSGSSEFSQLDMITNLL